MKPHTAEELAALYAQYPSLEDSMRSAEYINYYVQKERNKYNPRHVASDTRPHWYITYDAAGNRTFRERT